MAWASGTDFTSGVTSVSTPSGRRAASASGGGLGEEGVAEQVQQGHRDLTHVYYREVTSLAPDLYGVALHRHPSS